MSQPEMADSTGGNIRRYLRACRDACTLPVEELGRVAGYTSVGKFQSQEADWLIGRRSVPLSYLTAIGVDLLKLREEADKDLAAYQEALARPEPATRYLFLRMAGFATPMDLPVPLDEAAAVGFVSQRHSWGRCVLKFGPKTVIVAHDGITTWLPEPGFRIARKTLVWAERQVFVAPRPSVDAEAPTHLPTGQAEEREGGDGSSPGAAGAADGPESQEVRLRALRDDEEPPAFLQVRGKRFTIGPTE